MPVLLPVPVSAGALARAVQGSHGDQGKGGYGPRRAQRSGSRGVAGATD
jgi:hypothetical protein